MPFRNYLLDVQTYKLGSTKIYGHVAITLSRLAFPPWMLAPDPGNAQETALFAFHMCLLAWAPWAGITVLMECLLEVSYWSINPDE